MGETSSICYLTLFKETRTLINMVITSGEWVADLGDMTCRNVNSKVVVAMEKSDPLFIGTVIDMPVELRERWTADPDGEKLREKAVMEAVAAFYWAYNDKAIKAFQRRQKRESARVTANMHKMRFEKFWKRELIETANYILKVYGKKINIAQIFTLEKKIMVCLLHIRQYKGFYCNANRNYPQRADMRSFPVKDGGVDKHIINGRYDLMKGKNVKVKLKDFFNGFVNVNVYPYFMTGNIITGIFFYSDSDTNDFLYHMELFKFAEILFSLGKDEETGLEPVFDDEGNLTHFEFTGKWK